MTKTPAHLSRRSLLGALATPVTGPTLFDPHASTEKVHAS